MLAGIRLPRMACLALGLAIGLGSAALAQSPLPPQEPTQRAAPGASQADDEQALIVDFLEKGYLQAWFAHPASVRQHFADPVENYWGRRNVALSEVVREKLGYARKWIFRFYRLHRDTVKFEAVSGRASTWKVTFTYDFMADSAPPRSEGVGETTLVLAVDGDQVKILSEGGRVLERKRTGA